MRSRICERGEPGRGADGSEIPEFLRTLEPDEHGFAAAHGESGDGCVHSAFLHREGLFDVGLQVGEQVVDEIVVGQTVFQVHSGAAGKLFAGEDVRADHDHFLRLVFGIEFGEHPGDAECVDRHRVFIPEISVENINHGVLLLRGVAGRQQDVHVRIASGGRREIRAALESSVGGDPRKVAGHLFRHDLFRPGVIFRRIERLRRCRGTRRHGCHAQQNGCRCQ